LVLTFLVPRGAYYKAKNDSEFIRPLHSRVSLTSLNLNFYIQSLSSVLVSSIFLLVISVALSVYIMP
jgi:hypothetical protein